MVGIGIFLANYLLVSIRPTHSFLLRNGAFLTDWRFVLPGYCVFVIVLFVQLMLARKSGQGRPRDGSYIRIRPRRASLAIVILLLIPVYIGAFSYATLNDKNGLYIPSITESVVNYQPTGLAERYFKYGTLYLNRPKRYPLNIRLLQDCAYFTEDPQTKLEAQMLAQALSAYLSGNEMESAGRIGPASRSYLVSMNAVPPVVLSDALRKQRSRILDSVNNLMTVSDGQISDADKVELTQGTADLMLGIPDSGGVYWYFLALTAMDQHRDDIARHNVQRAIDTEPVLEELIRRDQALSGLLEDR